MGLWLIREQGSLPRGLKILGTAILAGRMLLLFCGTLLGHSSLMGQPRLVYYISGPRILENSKAQATWDGIWHRHTMAIIYHPVPTDRDDSIVGVVEEAQVRVDVVPLKKDLWAAGEKRMLINSWGTGSRAV